MEVTNFDIEPEKGGAYSRELAFEAEREYQLALLL